MITMKGSLFPINKTPEEEKKRGENIVNLMYSLASNRPNKFGVYKVYAEEELNELLSHYEEDLKLVAETSKDPELLTRLAQTLYVMKTKDFEGIFKRVERKLLALNEEGKVDEYHVVNLLRALTHS